MLQEQAGTDRRSMNKQSIQGSEQTHGDGKKQGVSVTCGMFNSMIKQVSEFGV
jgi:hypothetical protein